MGVLPLADKPPSRSQQKPYSIVQDNPERKACGLWGDLVKGRLMVYTSRSEHLAEELMESRRAYASQKDVTSPDQAKARYISDPRIEMKSRIDTDRHPRRIVPKQQNVARTFHYWQRMYPGGTCCFSSATCKALLSSFR